MKRFHQQAFLYLHKFLMKVMHCGLFFNHQDPTLPHPLDIQQFSIPLAVQVMIWN